MFASETKETIMKSKNNGTQKETLKESCSYNSSSECPYSDRPDKCIYNKKSCILDDKRIISKTTLLLYITLFCCLCIFLLSLYLSSNKCFEFTGSYLIYSFMSGLSLSIITGTVITLVIDIPSRLQEYEGAFINALSSNSYLKKLDENRLSNLRKDITLRLHDSAAPCMARGLINIDQRICELLRKPYYSRYRQSIICTNIDGDEKYIIKENTISYKLINPYSINKEVTEYIRITNLVILDDNDDETIKKNSLYDIKLICKIDDNETIDYSQDIILRCDKLDKKVEFYNAKAYIDSKSRHDDDSHGIRINFKKSISVQINYKIKVAKADTCFTKRLQHPAKNFRLDYAYNENGVKLFGQIFGTELKQSDFTIQYVTDNIISLEAFEFLLPDNGAIVVVLK